MRIVSPLSARTAVATALLFTALSLAPFQSQAAHAAQREAVPTAHRHPTMMACITSKYTADFELGVAFHYDSCSNQASVDVYYVNGLSSPGCPMHLNAKLFDGGNQVASVDSDCGGNSTSTGYHPVSGCANTKGDGTEYYISVINHGPVEQHC